MGLGQMGAVGVQIRRFCLVGAALEEFGQGQGDQGTEHRQGCQFPACHRQHRQGGGQAPGAAVQVQGVAQVAGGDEGGIGGKLGEVRGAVLLLELFHLLGQGEVQVVLAQPAGAAVEDGRLFANRPVVQSQIHHPQEEGGQTGLPEAGQVPGESGVHHGLEGQGEEGSAQSGQGGQKGITNQGATASQTPNRGEICFVHVWGVLS